MVSAESRGARQMPKFLQRDRSQQCLLPPDMRDWLPEDDLAHFVVEAVERVPMESFQVNERGTGSAQCQRLRDGQRGVVAGRARRGGAGGDRAEGRRRRHDFRPEPPPRPAKPKPAKEPRADWIKAMQEKMELPENRAHCRLRRQTVEPAFGIVKQAMGFRQFLLRGVEKVEGEWTLATLVCNGRRLHNLMLA